MHTAPSLVKSATQPTYVNTPMGRWVEDIVRNRIQNKPLSTVYDTQAASMTPEQRAPYDLLVRNRQSQAAGQLTDLLQYGLAAGGVYGLAKGIPKLLKTRKALATPEAEEGDLIDLEKDATWPQEQSAWDKITEVAGNMVNKGVAAATGTAWGEIPKRPDLAQLGSLPPGSLWPLYAGIPVAAGVAGSSLVDKLSDKVRSHMIMRKKRKIQKQFEGMLQGEPKMAAANLLEKLATSYEKQALLPEATGAAITLGTLLAGIGGTAGYHMGKMYSPGAVKKKALEEALRRKSKDRPLVMRVEPTDYEDAYAEPQSASALDKAEFSIPMRMPNRQAQGLMGQVYDPQTLKLASHLLGNSNTVGKLIKRAEPTNTVQATTPAAEAPGMDAKEIAKPGQPAPVKTEIQGVSAEPNTPAVSTLGGIMSLVKKAPEMAASYDKAKPILDVLSGMEPSKVKSILDTLQSIEPEKIKGMLAKFQALSDAAGSPEELKAMMASGKQMIGQYKGISDFAHNAWGGIKDLWGQAKPYLKDVGRTLMSGVSGLGEYLRQQPQATAQTEQPAAVSKPPAVVETATSTPKVAPTVTTPTVPENPPVVNNQSAQTAAYDPTKAVQQLPMQDMSKLMSQPKVV